MIEDLVDESVVAGEAVADVKSDRVVAASCATVVLVSGMVGN